MAFMVVCAFAAQNKGYPYDLKILRLYLPNPSLTRCAETSPHSAVHTYALAGLHISPRVLHIKNCTC